MTSPTLEAEFFSDKKTAAIVGAARKMFLTKGFDAASMDEIALTASVSKRTVYNRFRSKEELFGAAIEQTCKSLVPVNMAEIDPTVPAEEFIKSLSIQFVEGLFQPDALSLRRIAAFEAERTPEIGRTYMEHGPQWMVDQCAPLLAKIAENSSLDIDDPKAALWQLGVLITEPLHTRLLMGAAPKDLPAAIAKQVDQGVRAFFKLYST
ncbi:MAG: TetR/AcrR family transcriptional regulator [Marinicaulis sp.]|nr:TetR/AcrR family transcriptional regulator [Marinicaulis sp.]NNE39579.1 TetR/AcrR family transcriptional regulator [Marinicaulis sp.]NNL90095.1 TetR/AcrR family transcriptional regulator [Marinicaulis sp.]